MYIDGGFWDFTANLKHGDTAYTNVALKAHTDTTYFVCRPISPMCFTLTPGRRILVAYNYSIFCHIQMALVALRFWLMAFMSHPSYRHSIRTSMRFSPRYPFLLTQQAYRRTLPMPCRTSTIPTQRLDIPS